MRKVVIFLLVVFFVIAVVSLVNAVFASALLVLFVLGVGTLALLKRFGALSSRVVLLFLLVLFIHLGATLIVHYMNFYPFGGGEGDQWWYHKA
ncbi:MAG: hypothetical protein Q8P03_00470, partial [bacterium]|nr:hypothetical protein [bacterium]